MSVVTMIVVIYLAALAAGCFLNWLDHGAKGGGGRFCPRCGHELSRRERHGCQVISNEPL
ncbi:MAG TPA: hypothetical protein VIM11_22505 [Tepidisphaeraceae bacterium]|jgi:hypothetical protein